MRDFDPSSERPMKPARSPVPAIVAIVALLAIAGGIAYFFLIKEPPPPPPETQIAQQAPTTTTATTAAEDEVVPEPEAIKREDGDTALRRLVKSASDDERLTTWMSVDGILQRLAAAARLVADGRSPRPMLSFLEISGDFEVLEEGSGENEKIYVDPKSYARYDELTKTLTSLDPEKCGRAYRQLRPYLKTIYAQVAKPGESFDSVMSSALGRLTRVQLPEDRVELVPKGAIYLYKDPALEALSPAEKHILRMGRRNASNLQAAIRKCAAFARLKL